MPRGTIIVDENVILLAAAGKLATIDFSLKADKDK